MSGSSLAYTVGCFAEGLEALAAGRRLLGVARTSPVSVTVEVVTDSHAGPERYTWLPEDPMLTATYPAAVASQVSALVEGQPGVLFEPIPFDNAEYMLRLALHCSIVPTLQHVPPVTAWISGTYPAGTVEQRLVEVAGHDQVSLEWFGCHWPGTPDGLNAVILRLNSAHGGEQKPVERHEVELHVGAWYDEDSPDDTAEQDRCDSVAAQVASAAGLSLTGRTRVGIEPPSSGFVQPSVQPRPPAEPDRTRHRQTG